MKLAIIGSRSFKDYNKFIELLFSINDISLFDTWISGEARGTDSLVKYLANEKLLDKTLNHYIGFKPSLAALRKLGKFAFLQRDILIVNECDKLVAFWDGKSTGTKYTMDLAKSQNKLLKVFMVETNIKSEQLALV